MMFNNNYVKITNNSVILFTVFKRVTVTLANPIQVDKTLTL